MTLSLLDNSGAEDTELLRVAHEQGRVFVTRDRDFGGLVFVQGSGPGVVYLRILPSMSWYKVQVESWSPVLCESFGRFETRLVLFPGTEKTASGGPGGGDEPPGRRHGCGEIVTRCPLRSARSSRSHPLVQLLLGGLGPRLPARQLHHLAVRVNFLRHQGIAAALGSQRPVRTQAIVALAKFGQARAGVQRIRIHPPVDLLRLERLVDALQQTQLLRRAVGD